MMKRILSMLFALSILSSCLLLPGCSEQKDEIVPFDPNTFTNAKMLEDYDYIWEVLQENCAVIDLYPQASGIDLEQLQMEFRAQVEGLADGDAEGFANVLHSLSKKFGGFAHINAISSIVYHHYLDANTWESQTQKELFSSPSVRAYYQWEDTMPAIQRQLEQMRGKSNQSQTDEPAADEVIRKNLNLYRQGDVAVIIIKTFNFYDDVNQAVIDELSNFCLENIDAKDFIVDIRGIEGGSTNIWMDGLLPLWAGKKFEYNLSALYKRGDVNMAMWDGWPDDDEDTTLYSIAEASAAFPLLEPSVLESCDGLAVKHMSYDFTKEKNPGGQEFEGHIWLLTNEMNFSSAEVFVQFAKSNELFTLAGAQTKGGGGSMASPPNMDVSLPNCGKLFRFNPLYLLNEDGTCNDLEGTRPTIELSPGENAMKFCMDEIKRRG